MKKTLKEYIEEVASTNELEESRIKSTAELKRTRLNDRTPKQQAAINAAKASKPKPAKVIVKLEYDDGTVDKKGSSFKLMRRDPVDWDNEAQQTGEGHLKNMQYMYKQFPDLVKGKPQPVAVHSVEIKK